MAMPTASKTSRPGGIAILSGPNGVTEQDTYSCGHCQAIVQVPPRASPSSLGGLCKVCMHLICPRCTDVGTCTPWERQMEKMEARQRAHDSYGV